MSEAETKTITGVWSKKPEERDGWYQFEIDYGGEHPLKVSTKLQPVIELALAARDQLATWTYKEVDAKNINPHSNKPYKNRYLERVEIGGASNPSQTSQNANVSPPTPTSTATPQTASQAAPQPSVPSGLIGREKDIAIARMAALKTAAHLYGAVLDVKPEDDDANDIAFFKVLETATRLVAWTYRDTALEEEVPFA